MNANAILMRRQVVGSAPHIGGFGHAPPALEQNIHTDAVRSIKCAYQGRAERGSKARNAPRRRERRRHANDMTVNDGDGTGPMAISQPIPGLVPNHEHVLTF
jgi:hypothetical protein